MIENNMFELVNFDWLTLSNSYLYLINKYLQMFLFIWWVYFEEMLLSFVSDATQNIGIINSTKCVRKLTKIVLVTCVSTFIEPTTH